MLDSKKRLFENIAHRDNISSHHLTKSAGRKLSLLISRSPSAAKVADRDIEVTDVCYRVKDEEEEAGEAVLFFDQPTPVIEMKSFLSQKDSATTPITTTSTSITNNSSSNSSQRSAHNVFASHELDDSFDHQILPTHGFGHQSGHQSMSQSESLSTPVVDPNFAPAFSSSHSLTHMDQSALYEPFQMEQAEYVNPHRMLIDPVIPDTPTGGFPLQYADPPQYQRFDHCQPEQSSHRLNQLPESVMEIHRPSISSVGPSESSSSSPPASPKAHSDLKRKRSDSESGKKGRMTKKQQFDALCSRKSQLEEDNFNLKDKVEGYERACRRLKQMLYNRIKQQRA